MMRNNAMKVVDSMNVMGMKAVYRYSSILALLLASAIWALAFPLNDPVDISSGPISGALKAGVHSYLGIPYAAPPVRELRWRSPQAPAPWAKTRAMTACGPSCPQGQNIFDRADGVGRQSEDCLYLNVWTPAKDTGDLLPVMVWIHGGGFVTGSGSKRAYDGTNLARLGAVVVAINYRLGPFGFFTHPAMAKENPGGAVANFGLQDQVFALRWVKENIAKFGGNPDNITIFGESAGAVSVLSLMTSPPAKGLFHRVIAQSGAAPGGLRSLAESHSFWKTKAAIIGVTDWDNGLAELRKKSAAEILAMYVGMNGMPGTSTRDMLCRDGIVLPEDPADVFEQGKEAAVPLMIGSNADEGTIFAIGSAPKTRQAYGMTLQALFPRDVEKIMRQYPAPTDADASAAYAAALGDAAFTASARRAARWHVAAGGATYRYFFTRAANFAVRLGLGAFHGSEIPYVFAHADGMLYSAADRELSNAMSAYWVAFAKSGIPAAAGAPDWPIYDITRETSLILDTKITTQDKVRDAECNLWDSVLGARIR